MEMLYQLSYYGSMALNFLQEPLNNDETYVGILSIFSLNDLSFS